MKTVGVIGGIGPESTIEYYRQLIAAYRALKPDGTYPPIIINSINLKALVDLFDANNLSKVIELLVSEIRKLAAAGAEYGLLSANTPHIVFDEVKAKSPIPFISIVEATCDYARSRGMKRLALFGTRYTMQADFYQKVFRRAGMELIVPEPKDQDYIHEKYFAELVPGILLPATRENLLAIVDRMRTRTGIEGVILAGTELALILRGESHNGIPLLDTGKIHCQAAVDEMLKWRSNH